MAVETSKVKSFYNKFSQNQLNTGVNLRHYSIFNAVVKAGLKRNHKILEIGCGIGTLTGLLAKYVKKGGVVATDISDVSIDVAKDRLKSYSNIEYVVTDMQGFTHKDTFDFVVLPDVLEHIPVEQHHALFEAINKLIHDQSKIIIHIPHPKSVEYNIKYAPEKLQVIDQPLSAAKMLEDAYAHHFILDGYVPYSLFNQESDYVLVKLKRDLPEMRTSLSKQTIIFKKLIARIKYMKYALFS